MVCTGPIFRRMIVVPLENTITCGESMGTPDYKHDNFCKKAVSSYAANRWGHPTTSMIIFTKKAVSSSSKSFSRAQQFTWSPGMSELFSENDGMYGSHLSQDDSCTIGEYNHMRRIDGDTRR